MTDRRRLLPGRPEWPERLDHLADPPRELWVRGPHPLPELCASPSLAVVGSRQPSLEGRVFARNLTRDLAAAGVSVVSGLALGIDAVAHAAALAVGGRTIAVLGCGIDLISPKTNEALGLAIEAHGAVVSEWGPGVEPAPWRFPVRNRIIAALSDATLVVEATVTSGSLITVDHALALGRDVLAVPGSPWNPLAAGTNKLIRDGAVPVTCAADVLDAMGVRQDPKPDKQFRVGGLPGRVWTELRQRPARADMLALELGLRPGELAGALAELDLAGLVVAEPNGFFSAVKPQ
jgi:DNA processing protein